ncbi:MAG: prolyl oligopeptidase family serine peptidase [Bacteroidales bacterium]|nr:prolyl oligopeptidase family serine peptidase [Bacteroidales bacterium]
MKRKILFSVAIAISVIASAQEPAAQSNQEAVLSQTINIDHFRYAGPFEVKTPHQVDTLDIAGKPFDPETALDRELSVELLKGAGTASELPATEGTALHLLGFTLENAVYSHATLKVEGLKHHRLLVDGRPASPQLKLEPGTHDFVIKALTLKDERDTLKISVLPEKDGRIALREDGGRIYSLDANTIGLSCGGISVSPRGKYIALTYRTVDAAGESSSYTEIQQASDGKVLVRTEAPVRWMPARDQYYYTRADAKGRNLYCADPATGHETLLATGVPEGWFTVAPSEDYLLYTLSQEGPKEGAVHQILTPDDRQPGWRDRSYLAKFDLATRQMQQLTFGWHDIWPADIARDGRKVLFFTQRERLTARPTTLFSVWQLDVRTLEAECLVEDDGFVRGASYSPDGKQLVLTGSPEAFGGIGMKGLKPGQIPNMYDIQMYVMDIASREVKPLTADFAPSVDGTPVWAAHDGRIYFATEDKDVQNLYRVSPSTGKIERLANKEEYLYGFDIASSAPLMVYSGQSLCNGDRAYTYNVNNGKQRLVMDFGAVRFESVELGAGGAYEFTSSRGDLINGFYVLPPHFDPAKKYPLLVHYYGGCSPSARYCTGSYSPQVYAAQDYVFYVVNPSGAAGFGQEFAARHVNTAGDVVADDIIEATRRFCADHPFVDTTKIGCFSASYGGFMTQLLLTKTDLYAAGISHAGISDHTSYWGEGYWGYSYSEVSMAGSFPWTRKDLYVDRSPLYNADKIHTPLLFLHGSADTNVPIGESIQMFTALKLLGEDTAFVVVDGENHGIREFSKRRDWLRTIFAWFSKYLHDDPTWWDDMYPSKNL